MTKNFGLNLVLFFFLYFFLGGFVSGIDITNCDELTSSNKIYKLMNDIKINDTCFVVKANGVVLDLNGYMIQYEGKGVKEINSTVVSRGVYVNGYNDFKIKNGKIFGFGKSIEINNSLNNVLENLEMEESQKGAEIEISQSANNTIKNIVIKKGYATGIILRNASNNVLINVICNNRKKGEGIFIDSSMWYSNGWRCGVSSNNILENITTNFNEYSGIYVGDSVKKIVLKNVISVGNGNEGINLVHSSDAFLENILVKDNVDNGVFIQHSWNVSLKNVKSEKNGKDGFLFSDFYVGFLEKIVSINNSRRGISLYGDNNNFENIVVENNLNQGIILFSSFNNSFRKVSSKRNGVGFYFYRDSRQNILKESYIGNNEIGLYFNSYKSVGPTGNKIYNNFINNDLNTNWSENFTNDFYISPIDGVNVVGCGKLGGNVWGKPGNKGYSYFCNDSDNDGICDDFYSVGGGNVDNFPLKFNGLYDCKKLEDSSNFYFVFGVVGLFFFVCFFLKKRGGSRL